MIVIIISLSFLIMSAYCILILKWNSAWKKIPVFSHDGVSIKNEIKISVIIPVRNESLNIKQVLNSISQQDYPKYLFDIIVSDDQSSDDTIKLAKEFFLSNPDLDGKILEANATDFSSKKTALKNAIEISWGELIVTTDADCSHPKEWLSTIAHYYSLHKPVMICGPVLMKGNENFFQQFQMTEYLSLQVCGAASLYSHRPLLCSAANLSFTKEKFLQVNGYDDNLHIGSGDDTFLMLKMENHFPGKVHFLKSKEAIVTTNASHSFKDFFQQRLRWVSKTKFYSGSYIKAIGIFITGVNFFFLFLLLSSVFYQYSICIAVVFLSVKIICDYSIVNSGAQFFNSRISKFKFALMGLMFPFYLLILIPQLLNKSIEWKHRTQST